MVSEFFGKAPNKSLNPDEVVVMGAAVQAGILAGEFVGISVSDLTPLSLGIETLGGEFVVLIKRNTPVPTRKSRIFSTAEDNQTSIEVHVLQSERPIAAENRSLGKFLLGGIPPATRGMPQIEVAFELNANGILDVSAKEISSGREHKMTITPSFGLSNEEIDRMRLAAEVNEADDLRKRQKIETRNELDALRRTLEKLIDQHPGSLDARFALEVDDLLANAKSAMRAGRSDEMKDVSKDLRSFATHLYEKIARPANMANAEAPAASESSYAELDVELDADA